jgi:hypothetical protein
MADQCELWLGDILEADGIIITRENRDAVERGIRDVLGENVGLGTCRDDWRIIRNRVSKDPAVRHELVSRIKEEMEKEKVAVGRA